MDNDHFNNGSNKIWVMDIGCIRYMQKVQKRTLKGVQNEEINGEYDFFDTLQQSLHRCNK